jgi:beta-glucosidase
VTLPAWFSSQGGWLRRDSPHVFGRFVERVVEALGERCTRWIPLVEPEHLVTMAWLEGVWPPGKGPFWSAFSALNHLLHAHAESYAIIHRIQADAEVGISIRARNCDPLSVENAWDLRAARREMHRANHVFPSALCRGEAGFPLGGARRLGGTADFIAVSYYGKEYVRFHARKPLQFFRSITDSKGNAIRPNIYETAPEGLRGVLNELARYEKPIIIAGNGLNTSRDSERCAYIAGHLEVLNEAIAGGIDVRGYLHRSFLDGFEWTDGYSARYGLVHVDRETLARTPNPSAYFFKEVCESGTIRPGAAAKFALPVSTRVP